MIQIDPKITFKSSLKWQKILERTNGNCAYCGLYLCDKIKSILTEDGIQTYSKDWEIDHIEPRSKGGKSSKSNLIAACKRCNQMKKATNLEEFRLKLFGSEESKFYFEKIV